MWMVRRIVEMIQGSRGRVLWIAHLSTISTRVYNYEANLLISWAEERRIIYVGLTSVERCVVDSTGDHTRVLVLEPSARDRVAYILC